MASNGLNKQAKKGTCRICQRVRKAEFLKKVGEVSHGFAVGYIWECEDIDQCKLTANNKLKQPLNHVKRARIENALKAGNFTVYKYCN